MIGPLNGDFNRMLLNPLLTFLLVAINPHDRMTSQVNMAPLPLKDSMHLLTLLTEPDIVLYLGSSRLLSHISDHLEIRVDARENFPSVHELPTWVFLNGESGFFACFLELSFCGGGIAGEKKIFGVLCGGRLGEVQDIAVEGKLNANTAVLHV